MSAVAKLAVVDSPGSEAWSTKIRRRAKSLVKSIDQGYMDLAEIVYTVWSTPVDGVKRPTSVCRSQRHSNRPQSVDCRNGDTAPWTPLDFGLVGTLGHRGGPPGRNPSIRRASIRPQMPPSFVR